MLEMEDSAVLLDTTGPDMKNTDEPNRTKWGDQGLEHMGESDSRKPWWSIEFYQQYFNVTTIDVVNRLSASMVPLPSDMQSNSFQENPDLYGPFWVCTSLALGIGLSSSFAHYNQNYGHQSWRQTVRTVYQAGVVLFLYCWCLPTILWIRLDRHPSSTHRFRLPELWCIFGYAASIWVPACAVWAVPIIWLRWLVANLAMAVSGLFVCQHLKKALGQLPRSSYLTLLTLFFILNYITGCSLVILFFPNKFHVTPNAQTWNIPTNSPEMATLKGIRATEEISNITGNFSKYSM